MVGLAVSVRDSVVLETVPPVGGIYECPFAMSCFDKNKSLIKNYVINNRIIGSIWQLKVIYTNLNAIIQLCF